MMTLLLIFLSSWLSISFVTVVFGLPAEFSIISTGNQGPQLVWTSSTTATTKQVIRIGASRYEFRRGDGTTIGYPREINNQLVLNISNKDQEIIVSKSETIEVWRNSRRIDSGRHRPKPGNLPPLGSRQDFRLGYNATVPNTPTVPINPAQRGNYTIRRSAYNLTYFTINEYYYPIEVVGEVTDPPVLLTPAPLIIFLHGRHSTCYSGGQNGSISGDWPCDNGMLPIPSHKGYRYVADILASQGYIVVSISANGINGQDYASEDAGSSSRSKLIRYHLNLWVNWTNTGNDPWGGRFRGRLNMSQVVLVGHSRGGEGIHKAAIDATISDPYKIVGLASYSPTAVLRQVTPDIHSITILPTCDGDVSDLQGQVYVDGTRDLAYSEAIRSAIISLGTNHNYFNTEWTPGLSVSSSEDDWLEPNDPICGMNISGSYRLTAKEQRTVSAIYTTALVKLAIRQDQSMLQFMDGSFVRPAALGRAEVAVNAVGGANHRYLYRPQYSTTPTLQNGMKGNVCTDSSDSNLPLCREGNFDSSIAPHWQPPPSHRSMELVWTKKGASVVFNVSFTLSNLTAHDWIDVRIANDPDKKGAQFDLLVVDKDGKNASLQTALTTIEGWPGNGNPLSIESSDVGFDVVVDRIHARTLRGSLQSVQAQINLNSVVSVVLVTRNGPGKAWVLDIAASQAQIKIPIVLDLPKLSVVRETKTEQDVAGNKGSIGNTIPTIKVRADKPLTAHGSIYVQTSYGSFHVDLEPNPNSTIVAKIPLQSLVVENDYVYSSTILSEGIAIYAVSGGIVIDKYYGFVNIIDNERRPRISTKNTTAIAHEGQFLRWTIILSNPTDGYTINFRIVLPTTIISNSNNSVTELDTNDVHLSWLKSIGYSGSHTNGIISPDSFLTTTTTVQTTPLSELFLYVPVRFDYGERIANLFIPIKNDTIAEVNEYIVLELDSSTPLRLIGIVPAHH